MAFSREIRLPFLDHRLVELVFQMPSRMKISDGMTKAILRRTMRSVGLPAAITERHDKKGYPTPFTRWLRTFASAPARERLGALAVRGLADGSALQATLEQHVSGQRDHSAVLWRFLALEAWLRLFLDRG